MPVALSTLTFMPPALRATQQDLTAMLLLLQLLVFDLSFRFRCSCYILLTFPLTSLWHVKLHAQ
jgi:hypothetical protein